jgi:23S rRNA (guanosine2251-2'-O)-methyltransferase
MSTDRPQKPPYPKKRPGQSGKPYSKPYGKPHYGKPRFGGPQRERSADAAPPAGPAAVEYDDEGKTLLFGVHAVEAALANPKRVVNKLFLTENAENRMQALLEGRGFEIERVTPRDLDRRLGNDTVHQGILLDTEPLEELPMNALARTARRRCADR